MRRGPPHDLEGRATRATGVARERTHDLEFANERLRAEMAEREQAGRARERALREAEEANGLKDDFLGTLSHELQRHCMRSSGGRACCGLGGSMRASLTRWR